MSIQAGFCQCGCGGRTTIAEKSNTRRGHVRGQPKRFIHGHNNSSRPYSDEEYLEEDRGYETPCWEWQRARTTGGYGQLIRQGKTLYAHRVSYETHVGPIPEGLHVLHYCDNPSCIRPDHLFAGTHTENMRDMIEKGRRLHWNTQKTHCKHGHEFTPENTYIRPNGKRNRRTCRECRRIASSRRAAARKAARRRDAS